MKEKLSHYLKVASHFSPTTKEFWLGLFHDTVEDELLPKTLCSVWKSLDSITRRPGEKYFDYIERLKSDPSAKRVKLADLEENLKRCPDSLKLRYQKAKQILNAE